MEHFPDQLWADFIRETGNSEPSEGLKAHVANGCPECTAAHDLWSGLRTFAESEMSYVAPQNLVRMAKLEFASRYPRNSQEARVADLVFDSLAQPALAGVRSGIAAARQLVYEADGLTVDLRLQKELRSQKICAVGQVLDKRVPQVPPAKGSVILWTAQGLPLLQTTPNEHGEFELEFENQDQMRLSIEMQGRSPVRISLPELR